MSPLVCPHWAAAACSITKPRDQFGVRFPTPYSDRDTRWWSWLARPLIVSPRALLRGTSHLQEMCFIPSHHEPPFGICLQLLLPRLCCRFQHSETSPQAPNVPFGEELERKPSSWRCPAIPRRNWFPWEPPSLLPVQACHKGSYLELIVQDEESPARICSLGHSLEDAESPHCSPPAPSTSSGALRRA